MSIKDKVYLAFLNVKSNKLKNFLIFFIVTLFGLMIAIIFSGKASINNIISKTINSDFEFRIIAVKTSKEERSNIVKKINKMNDNHILNVFPSNYYFLNTVSIKNNELNIDGYVDLYGFYPNIVDIDYGKKIENSNEIICSKDFYSAFEKNLTNDEVIDLDEEIGKTFNISFDQNTLVFNQKTQKYESKFYKTHNYDLKLVGVYSHKNNTLANNVCFVSPKLLEEIVIKSFPNNITNDMLDEIMDQLAIWVLVDKYENINEVITNLENSGLVASPAVTLDTSSTDTIYSILNIVVIVIVLLSILVSFLIIKAMINSSKVQINFYRLIGYKPKEIKQIFNLQFILLFIFSFITCLFLTMITKVGITNLIDNYPNYEMFKIFVEIKEMLIYYIIIVICVRIILFFLSRKKIYKYNIKSLVGN